MRRPHPRFDDARNAWVTRAGGKLKILAGGPKNKDTEAAAWDAFYAHMAKLGNPVEGSSLPALTLGQLADKYGDWMKREVEAGRMKQRTLDYYQDHIQRFLDAVGGRRPALGVVPHEVEMFKTSWHSVQAVQRLYNCGVEMGLLRENPVRSVKKPDLGQRERVLTDAEQTKLLDGTDKHFRSFLLALLHTIAPPQEVRALQWKHLVLETVPMFVLTDFKAKKRRKDRVRCRMRRLREKLELGSDGNGENVVAYTIRHTAATRARTSGVPDRVLADLMGHTSTDTTRRYQHPQLNHLAEAIRQANARKAQ